MNIQDIPGRTTLIDGDSYLFFSGFAYLGLPSLPEFQDLWKAGLSRYGTVFPSSRVSNTQHVLYQKLEDSLSDFLNYQATASFSSGYLAALAAVRFLAEKGKVFALNRTHPALHHETNICYFESIKKMRETLKITKDPVAIVLESVNPLTGEVNDLEWLSEVERTLSVLIDDSHGIGILGKKGQGITPLLPYNKNLKYLICYSLSKAFSCPGGGISGREQDIQEIKRMPPFTAASPMSPGAAFAWIEGEDLFQKQKKRLMENLLYFKERIKEVGNENFDGRLPACYFPDSELYEKALNHHILLSAFRYPTPTDQLMTRAIINALHTREDLDCLLKLMVAG